MLAIYLFSQRLNGVFVGNVFNHQSRPLVVSNISCVNQKVVRVVVTLTIIICLIALLINRSIIARKLIVSRSY